MGGFIMKFRHPAICPPCVILPPSQAFPTSSYVLFACLVDLGGVLRIFQYVCRPNPNMNMPAANIFLPIIMTWHVRTNVTQPKFDEWKLGNLACECVWFDRAELKVTHLR